ncbi:MAG: hypothetical protein M0R48_09890 [Candidatus Omnitrophica bacterium]|jgi:hypothetical protein|nr:hypothetical protein [Candidatus Omnitrophota bacterium]
MVKFIDENGKEFFSCSSAEARFAIQSVKEKREKIDPAERESQRRIKERDFILSKYTETQVETIACEKPYMDVNFIIDCKAEIEKLDKRITHLFMHPNQYNTLMKWERDMLEPDYNKSLLKTGRVAALWGMEVYVSKEIPENELYEVSLETEEEFFAKRFQMDRTEEVETLSSIEDYLGKIIGELEDKRNEIMSSKLNR